MSLFNLQIPCQLPRVSWSQLKWVAKPMWWLAGKAKVTNTAYSNSLNTELSSYYLHHTNHSWTEQPTYHWTSSIHNSTEGKTKVKSANQSKETYKNCRRFTIQGAFFKKLEGDLHESFPLYVS